MIKTARTGYGVQVFRSVLLDHVSTRQPKRPCEIMAELREDWGSLCDRRFQRALSALVKAGELRAIGSPVVGQRLYLKTRETLMAEFD